MAINRSLLGSESIKTNTDSVIEVRTTEPDVFEILDPPDIPGRLVGYYNGSSGFVELYIVDGSGLRLLKI